MKMCRRKTREEVAIREKLLSQYGKDSLQAAPELSTNESVIY